MAKHRRHRSRREFITGKALGKEIQRAGEALADEIVGEGVEVPSLGTTIRLGKRAMACEFDVIMNPGAPDQVGAASEALDLIDSLEDQMTVYRDQGELVELNRVAAESPTPVEPQLYGLLRRASDYSRDLEGAFDLTSGPLIALWRQAREVGHPPSAEEIAEARKLVGMNFVQFEDEGCRVSFTQPGVALNLGSIGKGYALDRAGQFLLERGVNEFSLIAGGSSLVARGGHAEYSGWPVSLQHPVLRHRKLGTLMLKNAGMSSSGSTVQFFEFDGRRYGHVIDPRTGWPTDELLTVTVVAQTAERAEALSTAFFVLGVEKALEYCHNHSDVAAVLTPRPKQGRTLQPLVVGLTEAELAPASPEEPLTFISH